ncbi:esterase [Cellulophaga sp. E16_2]|uniref:alpha/beta hydrolase n=1 Tax=unclassified Cellulophaga TaxID=2634405 RepID=UPI0013FD730D|nr:MULTISPECIES: esterase [unclassified Cellulophaga]MBO0593046.1 esterase [Cellulophaga sp. E16_2]
MNTTEKQVSYTTSNTYETLNTRTEKTKNVWIVFHGIGYLSRYFLKYFNELNPEENYIIAPQAPSKYYLNKKYVHVGASWLTKENTLLEMENVSNYLDAVLAAEEIPENTNIIVFGFSQGVSIASRWAALNHIKCTQLILYAGGIPNEMTPEKFKFLEDHETQVKVIVGTKDEYLNEERMQSEFKRIATLFNDKAEIITFEGGHEVRKDIINSLV